MEHQLEKWSIEITGIESRRFKLVICYEQQTTHVLLTYSECLLILTLALKQLSGDVFRLKEHGSTTSVHTLVSRLRSKLAKVNAKRLITTGIGTYFLAASKIHISPKQVSILSHFFPNLVDQIIHWSKNNEN